MYVVFWHGSITILCLKFCSTCLVSMLHMCTNGNVSHVQGDEFEGALLLTHPVSKETKSLIGKLRRCLRENCFGSWNL
jgi:hypothetical protein